MLNCQQLNYSGENMESSDTVGYEILKLLGVDTKHAYSADIVLVAGEPLEVVVTSRPPIAKHEFILEYVKEYLLVEKANNSPIARYGKI